MAITICSGLLYVTGWAAQPSEDISRSLFLMDTKGLTPQNLIPTLVTRTIINKGIRLTYSVKIIKFYYRFLTSLGTGDILCIVMGKSVSGSENTV
jgi:hypothetical protein